TSKELFGLMFRANYKKLNLTFIGSQTKGISEVQRYTGKTSFKKPTIADTAYISLRYYALSLSTGNLPLEKGSEKIYLDNITATDNQGLTVPMTAGFGFFGSTASYSGDFNLLVPGVDYTLDYQKGIINFRRGIGSNHVIAVDYRDSTGTLLSSLFGRSQIIKDEQDNLTMELKNRYNMGDNKIIRDPLGEKFILKILDTEGKETDSQGAPYINKVPLEIDYDLGIIEFNDERPFETAFGHSDVYDKTYKGRGRRHFDIYMEYRTRILSWQLRPSLVRDSEKVVIDGQLMERDRDYLIDYYTGWITFLDENKITDISNIEITYEYFPFLGGQQNTLGGMRLEFNPVPNFFGGSTILYSFSPQAQRIPDIRETPTSVLILDANLRWNFGPYRFLPFKFQLEGEGARSEHNPNRWDKALIENMEGIKQKDSFPMDEKVWLPASIETPVRGNLFLSRHDIPKKDINPNFQGVNENFSVLAFNYSIPSNGEVAVVYPISRQGTDYSEKEYVEMWLWGEGKNEELILELGSVNEDSDADNFLDTEDINLNGTLDEDEDTGWSLNNPDGTVKETVGKDNGLLDSEDLDQDGRLDTESNLTGIFTTLYDELDSPHASVNWSGWKKIKIPLLITEAEKNNWRTVKHVRLRLRGVTGSGRILLTALGVVGNRWEKGKKSDGSFSPTEYFDAVAVNNEDDLNYSDLLAHPDYTDLYAGEIREDTREQALALKYSLLETTTAYTEIVMASTAKMDFTRHRKLNFFIYGDNTGVEIFLKFGSDANNYFEFSETVSWNSWRHFILPIEDLNYDDLPDSFQYKKGNPNLNNISYLQIGIRNKTGQPAEGEIWVNEIYVSDAKTKTGSALKGTASVDVPGWLTVTGGYRDIDHNFESLTFSSPQDRKEKSGGVSLKRFSFLPFSVNYSKQETVTPPENITQSQEPMAQYLSKLDEGKVITETKGANANLNIKYLPQVSGSYSISTTSSTLSGKYDTSESAQAGATYSFPRFFRYLLLPPSVQSGASLTRKKTEFNELLKQTDFEDHNLSWNFSFPWQFFSFINLNSNYKYEERKARKLILENDEDNLFLPQMRSAEGRSNLSMKFTNWFVPNLNYTAKITENFLVPAATSAWISEGVTLKDINRTAKGSFTLPLNIAQIAPWMTPLKSLSLRTTLDLEDGETYKSVSTGLYTLDKFFLRDNRLKLKTLSPENPEAALYLLSSRKTQKYDAGWSPLGFLKLRGVFMPLQTASLQAYFTRIDDHNEQGTVRDIQTLIW
ncbi:MAG TPA: hypothetical protein VJC03_02800, partial [bacterium]|nr:hypothetical protein [bacterium]